jgi:hypothetical protein
VDPPRGQQTRRKRIPLNIKDYLIYDYSLVHWFLGDGWYENGLVQFAAGELTKEELESLQDCLLKNFGLKTSLVLNNEANNEICYAHHITLLTVSYNNFRELVQPYLEEFENFLGNSLINEPFLKTKTLPEK